MIFIEKWKYYSIIACVLVLGMNFSCAPKTRVISIDKSYTGIQDTIPEDGTILSLIEPYKKNIEESMQEVIAFSDGAMMKEQPESKLGNFVADLAIEEGAEYYKKWSNEKIDFCLLNYGGLRASLPKGEIVRRNIYELMPFENELVVVTLNGDRIVSLIDYVAQNKGMPVSGLRMGIKEFKPIKVSINELPLDSFRVYRVLTTDYLANGGDNMAFFKEAIKYESLEVKLRDAIIYYLQKQHKKFITISGMKDGRIYIEK